MQPCWYVYFQVVILLSDYDTEYGLLRPVYKTFLVSFAALLFFTVLHKAGVQEY